MISGDVCRYFVNGQCNRGNQCRYVHDIRTQSSNICQFHQQGKCSFGNQCRFYHVSRPRQQPRQVSNNMRHPRPNQNLQPRNSTRTNFNVAAPVFVPRRRSEEFDLAARPLCSYFETTGKCPKDNSCQLVHGTLCDLCNKWSIHPHNQTASAEHKKECTKKHTEAMEYAFIEKKSKEKSCGICMESIFENNMRFGILNGCKHSFCLSCIRQWRAHSSEDLETKVVRSCPECRQHSDYVIPSAIWVEEEVEKSLLIDIYKENTKATVCKYYNNARARGACPFGNKCFYKHQLPDGSIDPGESPHNRRRPQLSDWLVTDSEEESGEGENEDDDGQRPRDSTLDTYLRMQLNISDSSTSE